jgi:uncharacterized membrane protein YgcG
MMTDPQYKTIRHILVIALALLAFDWQALAQSVTLRGSVMDELDAVIPGAKVTLRDANGKERTATTDALGNFVFSNVPAGIYSVAGEFTGFTPQLLKDITLPLGTPLKLRLTVALVGDSVTTNLNDTAVNVEPDQNLTATVLGEEFIQNLPDNEDDLRNYLQALAGPGAGNGQGAQIIVDGFQNTQRLPPREAIMQIRMNNNPFSPEFSSNGSNRIEIITRPGYGDWRGNLGWNFRSSSLNARNAFALTRPELLSNNINYFLGGPILKKKLSVNFFGNRSNSDGSTNTFAKTLEGNFIANVPSESVNTFFGQRGDYLISKNNTLNFGYNYSRNEALNQEFSAGGGGRFAFFGGGGGGGGGGGFGGGGSNNRLPESASNRNNSSHNIRIGDTWVMNPKLLHETRFQYQRDTRNQTAVTDALAITVLDSFIGGGSTCCPNRATNENIEFQDYLTFTSKGSKHTIKGGFQAEWDRISDFSQSNFNGSFTFSNLDQYRRAVASLALDPATTPIPMDARATQFTLNRGTSEIGYSMFRGSWFVNDDWRISPTLTLSYGMRHEFQQYLQDKINFAPRFGIAWSPFKSRKTTFRFGGGVFYDRLRTNQYENSIRFAGQLQQSFTVANAIFGRTLTEVLARNTLSANTRANTTTRPLAADLKAPYDLNSSFSVEQQLPKGLTGSFTYSFSRGINQFRTRNINAPFLVNGVQTFPFPELGGQQVLQVESSAINETNRLIFQLNRRMGRVTAFGSYSLGWAKSNGDGIPADSYNLASEWGRASFDRRHNFNVGSFLTLPQNFRLNLIAIASSGSPFNITTGVDGNRDRSITDRPLLNGLPMPRNSDLLPSQYAQFAGRMICPPGADCSARATNPTPLIPLVQFLQQVYPNGVRAQSPGMFDMTASLSKTIGFGKPKNNVTAQGRAGGDQMGGGRGERGGRGPGGGGFGGPGGGMRGGGGGPGGGPMMMGMGGGGESSRYTVTFTVNASNIFNRVNLSPYSGTLGSSFFGRSSNASSARQVDISVRFGF